ncbi:MAG: NAD(P)H-hydrate dehydratase, partial [Candidatus Omnitrophota bacterium]
MVKRAMETIRPRHKETHKGDYGHVFILAGSAGMTGAAYLASQAALLSGSGLVTLGIPRSLNTIMEIKLTEVMTLPLDETRDQSLGEASEKKIMDFAQKADVLAIGPGISGNKETQRLIRRVVEKSDKPVVLDADGINAYAEKPAELKKHRAPLVLTPHPGEMSRITKKNVSNIQKDREGTAKKISREFSAVVLLKGYKTVVAEGNKVYVNESGNPGMATGGVGDVLTGIIASLIGQGLEPFGAAKLASYVHGLAGDMAMRERGEISIIASDILAKLPAAFK